MPKQTISSEKQIRIDTALSAAVLASASAMALLAACGGSSSGPQGSELPNNSSPMTTPSSTTLPLPGTGGLPKLPTGGVPKLPTGGVPALPTGGVPKLPTGGVPTLPTGGVPKLPTGGVPKLPTGGVPTLPTGGVPKLPTGGVPKLPTGGVPKLPTGGVPTLPTGGVPKLPTGGVPALPTGGVPKLPTGGVPALPTGGVPKLPTAGIPAISSSMLTIIGKSLATARSYDAALVNPETQDTVGFTVFEPANRVDGQTYPLVIHSNGYSGGRTRTLSASNPGVVEKLVAAGYGVISISPRGSDDSTGTVRLMDPDAEGKDLLSVLDWAESNLSWLKYGTGVDGGTHNAVVGAVGSSYGGMSQYLVNAIDPKHRLDAIAPAYAPHDLASSLYPNQVLKASWDSLLFGTGNAAMGKAKKATDTVIAAYFAKGLASGTLDDGGAFLSARSPAAYCATLGTGASSLVPTYIRRVTPTMVRTNALIIQGMRDTLFDFNEGLANYQCLKATGGDVRLLTTQIGHNALNAVADPGAVMQPVGNALDGHCGSLDTTAATLAFFDEYLKGVKGAANLVLPSQPCLSLTRGDAVLVDSVTSGRAGHLSTLPATLVVAGGTGSPMAIDLGITANGGDVVGGIPHLEITVSKLSMQATGNPVLLVGLGQARRGTSGTYDLIDNQLTPIKGTGSISVDMAGVAERLGAGDKLYLLVYGQNAQYRAVGSVPAFQAPAIPVTVQGKAWVPMLGQLANITKGS